MLIQWPHLPLSLVILQIAESGEHLEGDSRGSTESVLTGLNRAGLASSSLVGAEVGQPIMRVHTSPPTFPSPGTQTS